MNVTSGQSSASATEENQVSLFLSGDVMTGRGIDQALPYSVDSVLHETYIKNAKRYMEIAKNVSGPFPEEVSHAYIWGDALPELDKIGPDVRIVNLETAITSSGEPRKNKFIHYRMHPKNTPLLNEAGIDICVLGNNHILDWGYSGLRDTLQALNKQGLLTTGAGLNAESASAPAVFNTGKGRILVFSCAGPDAGIPKSWQATTDQPGVKYLNNYDHGEADKVIKNITSYRNEGDRTVLSIHWGPNWGYKIPVKHRRFAQYLIDSGTVDLIHGHSSHHPKGIEIYKNRLILYGCGDLINDYEGISGYEQYRDDLSLMYFPLLNSKGTLASLEMVPMKIHRFRLQKASTEDIQWLGHQLSRTSKRFGATIKITESENLILNW